MADRLSFAAQCLRGQPTRSIHAEDLEFWDRSHLLLPIADVLNRHGQLALFSPEASERVTHVRRIAAVSEAGERRTLGEVLSVLADADVDALLLKGAALSYTVYPLPWLRARSDVDLLVRPGSMQRVDAALSRIGFEAAREVSHPLITRQRHFARTRGLRVAIDVHEALVNPPVLRTLPEFDALYSRAQVVRGLPVAAKGLSTPDALLHALVHRVAHHNSSDNLLWLYDMHLLVRRMSAAEWVALTATAEQSRVCRIALDGLRALAAVLETDVPHDVMRRLDAARDEPSAALLGGWLTEWLLQGINLKSLPGVRARAELVRAHLAPPPGELSNGADRRWRLPLRYAGRVLHGSLKWLRPI